MTQNISTSMNNFGLNVFHELVKTNGSSNVFFSPASIYAALSMTYCGTRQKTSQELKTVLETAAPPENDTHHKHVNEVWSEILKNLTTDVTLEVANCLWVEQSYKINEQFELCLKKYYDTHATNVDFQTKTKESVDIINSWVDKKTHEKISEIISEENVSATTKLVITNAIYFKGQWKNPFNEKHTLPMAFKTSNKGEIKVPMMFKKCAFAYKEDIDNDCQVLLLPYNGCNISMLLVLPKVVDGLKTLQSNLLQDGNKLQDKIDEYLIAPQQKVDVFIPKFKFSLAVSVKENLKSLGVSELFSQDDANLSGISANNDLYVSDILHKAFIDVNEEGTEAAAATAVVAMNRCAMVRIPRFKVDHPFMFFIVDVKSKLIIFSGQVHNPLE